MSTKCFELTDTVIIISKHEVNNYWIGKIIHIDENVATLDIGTSQNFEDLEHYDEKINWIEFYRKKYPDPSLWEED